MDVGHRIALMTAIDPDADAICYEGHWTSWGRLRQIGAQIDEILAASGLIGAGRRVGLVMRTRPGHVAAILNVMVNEQCLEPINSIQSDDGVAAEIAGLGVPIVIADDEDWARPGLVERCTELGVVGIGLSRDAATLPYLVVPGAVVAEDLIRNRPGVAVWMPTSGTTGPPKRIPIGYDDLANGFGRVAKYSGGTEKAFGEESLQKGISLIVTPLVHIAGLWAVLQFAIEGRRAALLDRFEPNAWADLVQTHRPIIAALPPAAIRMVLDAEIPPEMLNSLRALGSGTAPLPADTADEFTAKYGVPVLASYGATEFPGGLVGWTLPDKQAFPDKRGSVGRARPGVHVRVVDESSGQAVAPKEQGLIEAMTGQRVGRDTTGWVRTNDLGWLDEDGFLWVTGRADDAINRGGFKIVPTIIEDALCAHPDVRAAVAVGLPDHRLGEVPVAAVESDAPLTEADLIAWSRQHLLHYQVPVRILVVGELPRTPSLKLSRVAVKGMFIDEREEHR